MPTTADEFALALSWIGPWEDQVSFDERYDRLGDLDDAVLESMRAHRAKLISRASSITVEDISISNTENIRALDRAIEEFTTVGGTEESSLTTNVTKLSRLNYR